MLTCTSNHRDQKLKRLVLRCHSFIATILTVLLALQPSQPAFGQHYQIDDGTYEVGYRWTGLPWFTISWLNQFTVIPGSETITSIQVVFGTPVQSDRTAFVCLWSDPNNDKNPSDAVLLRSVMTLIPSDRSWHTYLIPPITLRPGESFFIGVVMDQRGDDGTQYADWPILADRHNWSQSRSWQSARPRGAFEPATLGASAPASVTEEDHFCFLVRAIAVHTREALHDVALGAPSFTEGFWKIPIFAKGTGRPVLQGTVTLSGETPRRWNLEPPQDLHPSKFLEVGNLTIVGETWKLWTATCVLDWPRDQYVGTAMFLGVGFDPAVHGFRFENIGGTGWWLDNPFWNGACVGMTVSARAKFQLGLLMPGDLVFPTAGSRLWWELRQGQIVFAPVFEVLALSRVLRYSSEYDCWDNEWERVRSALVTGAPTGITLLSSANLLGPKHQVLGIGACIVDRYIDINTLRAVGNGQLIWVYDPNHPNNRNTWLESVMDRNAGSRKIRLGSLFDRFIAVEAN